MLVGPVPPPFGGIATYVNDLISSKQFNVRFSVFNTSLPATVAPLNREGKFSYSSLLENGFLTAVKMIVYAFIECILFVQEIFRRRPDVVHFFPPSFWGYWRHCVLLMIAKTSRARTVFHLLNAIDIFYERARHLERTLIRKSFGCADVYVLQSPGLAQWLSGYSSRKVFGLWNGVHIQTIPSKSGGQLCHSGAPIGLTVGGLGKDKGTQDLLQAIALVHGFGIAVRWVFVGNGDIVSLQGQARTQGVSEWVEFVGSVPEADKWSYYLAADFYCLPSYAEGQPLSILEAMAVGLPIISTTVGSIPEVVDTSFGILVKPGDTNSLASAIRSLASDGGLRISMGQKAREMALRRHDIRDLHRRIGNIYEELVLE